MEPEHEGQDPQAILRQQFQEFVTDSADQSLGDLIGDKKEMTSEVFIPDGDSLFAIAKVDDTKFPENGTVVRRMHFAQSGDPQEPFKTVGQVDVTTNAEYKTRRFVVDKFNEHGEVEQSVRFLDIDGGTELFVRDDKKGHRKDAKNILYRNNELQNADLFERFDPETNRTRSEHFTAGDFKMIESGDMSDSVRNNGDIRLAVETVEGEVRYIVRRYVDGRLDEEVSLPKLVEYEDGLHDLVPQDVIRFPESASSQADVFMQKDMLKTIFGERWLLTHNS